MVENFSFCFQTISFLLDYNMNLMMLLLQGVDYSGENRILANEKLGKDIIDNLSKFEKTIEYQLMYPIRLRVQMRND